MTIYVNHVPHADDVDLPPSLLTSTMPIALHVLFGHYCIKDGISEIACEVDRGRLTQGFNHKERRNLSLMRLCTSICQARRHFGFTHLAATRVPKACLRYVKRRTQAGNCPVAFVKQGVSRPAPAKSSIGSLGNSLSLGKPQAPAAGLSVGPDRSSGEHNLG